MPGHSYLGVVMTAVKARFALAHGELCVSQGNIVAFVGDAIVNAADHKCIYGKGVDGAINKAGGPALVSARRALPLVLGTSETRCPVGEARWTVAGHLPVRIVIHAVGPNFNPKAQWVQRVASNGEELLYNAYLDSMRVAREQQCASVAFSLLSAGFFRGTKPLHDILVIACSAIRDGAYPGLQSAHLLAFGQPNAPETHDIKVLQQAASSVGLKRLAPPRGAAASSTLAPPRVAAASSTSSASSSSSSSLHSCFAAARNHSAQREPAGTSAAAHAPSDELYLPDDVMSLALDAAVAAASASSSSTAPRGVSQSTAIEVSDGETEEDDVPWVAGPAAKKARG